METTAKKHACGFDAKEPAQDHLDRSSVYPVRLRMFDIRLPGDGPYGKIWTEKGDAADARDEHKMGR